LGRANNARRANEKREQVKIRKKGIIAGIISFVSAESGAKGERVEKPGIIKHEKNQVA
jgi:hypothetical protein